MGTSDSVIVVCTVITLILSSMIFGARALVNLAKEKGE